MSKQKFTINSDIVKWLIVVALPFILTGISSIFGYKWWDKVIRPLIKKIFGYDMPYPEDAVNKLIKWIIELILQQEKEYPETKGADISELNRTKFFNVVSKINSEAGPMELAIIKKKWGTIESAVQSIFVEKAKAIIEAKKAQK